MNATLRKGKKPRTVRGEIVSWASTIAVAVAAALFINSTLIVNAQVPSGSMESTINIGDRIIGNRLAYQFSKPQRGDVILFLFPDDESQLFIKRIIGLPGETVDIVDGSVYIDGEPLDEPYLNEDPFGSYGPFIVPEDCYFVMGDNRNQSNDSRFWEHHYVQRDQIQAKADFCYFPKPYMLTGDEES